MRNIIVGTVAAALMAASASQAVAAQGDGSQRAGPERAKCDRATVAAGLAIFRLVGTGRALTRATEMHGRRLCS